MSRRMLLAIALVVASAVAVVVHRHSTGEPQKFMRIEPQLATSPTTAPIVLWAALGGGNNPQVRLLITERCLDDLGGEAGLTRLSDALASVSDVDSQTLHIDRSERRAVETGAFVASFDLERTDYEAWGRATRTGESTPNPDDFRLTPVHLTDQRFVLQDGGWRFDGDCTSIDSQIPRGD